MILAVSGWRDHTDRAWIWHQLNRMLHMGYTQFRVGDAGGVDSYTLSWCRERVVPHTIYYADWTLGLSGGPIRNRNMLVGTLNGGELATTLLAMPQPGPRRPRSGTWDCIDAAFEYGVNVYIPAQKVKQPL